MYSRQRHNNGCHDEFAQPIAPRPRMIFSKSLHAARLFFAALFVSAGVAIAIGAAQAHPSSEAPAATVDEVMEGTVVEVVIDNRVDQTSSTYRELDLDDGPGVLLQGYGAEGFRNGNRVRLAGRRLG